MKKNIGSVMSLYPTPVIVVGAMAEGRPTWTLVAHIGIPSHDMAMVSLAKPHYINKGIRESKVLSINVVDESWLDKAAVTGAVSGNKTDKSDMLEYTVGETGAPLATEAKLAMECTVEDVYETPAFENFMVKVNNTFAEESILDESGKKPDFDKFKPVLFEMPGYTYIRTGGTIGGCLSFGKHKQADF